MTGFTQGLFAAASLLAASGAQAQSTTLALVDTARARPVPVQLFLPATAPACTPARPCPVALLSHGYGIGSGEYGFLVDALRGRGYLVASIDHEIPGDAKMDLDGDMVRQRGELARRGAANIRFVHTALSQAYPGYDWQRTLLVGHSMGGDSSARLASLDPAGIAALVTLDNRRAALPRSAGIRVLSLRASDTGADPGVLPTLEEQQRLKACIVPLQDARHNDMFDGGPFELRERIRSTLLAFLAPGAFACPSAGLPPGRDGVQ
ncbi:serine aminopeptidase domain-containing protein [Massilia yuzhufengensis]|uniref:Serine aminopeptidase, S33 n=1 Tax=Massilia yuzhufengensis TaxID=1164594 RepID=A0A1I1PN04_9BURK|nr:alpha/beta hydrolase [Massilia yuzhufengensis]SFD11181.1 Serine aminopeptidase, S33 [Massilia yuzhufengensis]